MRAEDLEEVVSEWKGREPMTDLFLNILSRGSNGWEQTWDLTRPGLEEYKEKFASPYIAAARGYLDDVIEPSETRRKLAHSLELLANKVDANPRKKHGNIPL